MFLTLQSLMDLAAPHVSYITISDGLSSTSCFLHYTLICSQHVIWCFCPPLLQSISYSSAKTLLISFCCHDQGDACHLPSNLSKFDAILAANLVCRLPEPMKFFERLPSLVKPGGVAVIISPHSWLPAWTPKSKWIGGYNKVPSTSFH
jgi:SAM-dependent methyltransferase